MSAEHDAVERLLRDLDRLDGTDEAGNTDPVVAAALSVRSPGRSIDVGRPASALEVLRDRVDDFAAAVAGVAGDGWQRHAAPYPWTVHQLVAHLAAVEAYVAWVIGVPGAPPPEESELDHLAMTEPAVRAVAEDGVDPAATVAAWRAGADRVAAHIEAGGPSILEEQVVLHGFPMSVRSMLIVRGFELWTHADDIRRATGRSMIDPPPAVVHTMSALSVVALPLLTAVDGPATARIVLTGPGGGAWTIALGGDENADDPGDEPDVELLASAVDWCRLASSRIATDRLVATVDGDGGLAGRLLAAAQTLAF